MDAYISGAHCCKENDLSSDSSPLLLFSPLLLYPQFLLSLLSLLPFLSCLPFPPLLSSSLFPPHCFLFSPFLLFFLLFFSLLSIPSPPPPPFIQAEVIRWLLSHNPHDRPTSKQLLQSTLLPLKMEDEELQEVCVCVCVCVCV